MAPLSPKYNRGREVMDKRLEKLSNENRFVILQHLAGCRSRALAQAEAYEMDRNFALSDDKHQIAEAYTALVGIVESSKKPSTDPKSLPNACCYRFNCKCLK